MDSEYITHHEAITPSLFKTMRAGTGVGDSSISSLGIGLTTFSLLERSSPTPIGDVSLASSVMDICARLESYNSVIVKTPATLSAGLSATKGVFDLLNKPISVDAEEATISRSWRFGGKSFRRSKK